MGRNGARTTQNTGKKSVSSSDGWETTNDGTKEERHPLVSILFSQEEGDNGEAGASVKHSMEGNNSEEDLIDLNKLISEVEARENEIAGQQSSHR